MDKFEKLRRRVDVVLHEPAKGRSVLQVIVLVQGARRLGVQAKEIAEEQRDALVDHAPNSAVGRI